LGESNLKVLYYTFLILFFFKSPILASENECQGAKLRVINKITSEKVFYDVPLSQTLELDNAKIIIFRCVKIENEGANDEIALISHKLNSKLDKINFLGWIFKSSQYLNVPVNPTFDIKLEECLVNDPIFLKKSFEIL
tara:strand:+ start:297 stop:710 length:414 start_codon:yes stop_codon:yes gene_type:complete